MDEQQRQAFEQALERKNEEAKAKAEANQPHSQTDTEVDSVPLEASGLTEDARTQETRDVRAKGSRHGQVTADKWNQ